MINTYNVKQAQLKYGSFKVGTGKEVILLIGSCRSVMYLNYLDKWNRENGNRFTIHHLDPFNWSFDANDKIIDLETRLKELETDENLLNIFKSTDIYLHEYYQHFGMFNSKVIKSFGLNPKLEVCIPNFNDLFILFNDLLTFDVELKTRAKEDLSKGTSLSQETQDIMKSKGEAAIEKFYEVCRLSDLPEMELYFKAVHKSIRLFWSYNHVSRDFNLQCFKLMNEKFLKLHLTADYWNEISNWPDMFAKPSTGLTQYDKDNYGFNWNEPLKELAV
jgi:hypothetical protein